MQASDAGECVEHPQWSWRYRALAWSVIVLAALIAHGWSLGDGLFLDDHLHQHRMDRIGWSFSDLLNASTIEPERFMETWWQDKPVRWQYARPFAVLVMKVTHELSGGSVVAHHAVSLILHFIISCMVWRLCLMLTHHRFWSVVGGLLFVVYSHGVFAVAWLAAQNAVLQTALMFGALLCYVRASGLYVGPMPADGADRTGGSNPVEPPPPLNRAALAWAVVLWVLALFSRENAIMFPVLAVAFDLAFGGRRHAWQRRGVYAIMGAIALAFLVWRLSFFYHPMPDLYARRFGSEGYVLWCAAKLMHYLCSAVWLSPMTVGPTGRFNPFVEVPGDCLWMFGILAVMGTGYYLACRRARGYWIWPMWLVLAVLPAVPLLATPHTGYLCGVAFAVAMVLGPGLGRRIKPVWIGRWSRPVAVWFLIATCVYVPIYRTLWEGMLAAERYTPAQITVDPMPEGATDVFFINLPFVDVYGKLCLVEAWGPAMEDVRCHVLTYSSDLISVQDGCRLEQLDARRFAVSTEGRGFFSGLLGRFLIEGMRESGRLKSGQLVNGEAFDVRVVEADDDGVGKLVFDFHRPLSTPGYVFYLTTRDCPAVRVLFRSDDLAASGLETLENGSISLHNTQLAAARLDTGDAAAAEVLFAGAVCDDPQVRDKSEAALLRVARPVAEATGAPVQDAFRSDGLTAEDWTRIRQWWRGHVDDLILKQAWVRRDELVALRRTRDGVCRVRSTAGKVIETDLYLTGPTFPGPR